ncbi:recombinase family protein [Pseudosporangium ferrugineum]|uniref:recombinase family protein n=1 Tax=Pseudosporangium ferrugineum TaxID=439699 RepID=UPI000D057E2B|nr:recombinase family protein [Pseudosporangium ferrugineum]
MRAAIYCRISQDRAGAGLGVARQEEDCRALCEGRGWVVVEVYPDNDVSAYSGAPRPAWARLLADVRAGTVDAIVGWHVDRLTRSPRELEDVIDLADKYGVELATVTGDVDLSTPTGRLVARMLGAAARHEAEHKAERQKRQRRQAAEAGRVAGGGHRPFGYEADRVTIVPEEAEIIRECVRRVLAMESLASIVRDLTQRGITTTAGNSFKVTSLRQLLCRARISGRREHTPRSNWETTRPIIGDIVADAVWPGIITADESDRVRAILTDPDRQTRQPGQRMNSYLLTGLLVCHCGARLVGRPRSGVPRYVCSNAPGYDSCGKTATNTARTDDHVRDLVIVALDSPEFIERLRSRQALGSEASDAVKDDELQLEALAQQWARKEITRREWMAARVVVEQRLERNRAAAARESRRHVLRGFVGTLQEMYQRWERMNVSQRRAVLSATLHSITVNPADPRKRWDPDRFVPEWIA